MDFILLYIPANVTSGSVSLFADFEKNTVLLTLRCKHNFFNHLIILTISADNSSTAYFFTFSMQLYNCIISIHLTIYSRCTNIRQVITN